MCFSILVPHKVGGEPWGGGDALVGRVCLLQGVGLFEHLSVCTNGKER